MKIIQPLLLIFFVTLLSSEVFAEDIRTKFKNKKYHEIAALYDNKSVYRKLPTKDIILVSYSLRAVGRFRDDAKIVASLIKKHHATDHQKIHDSIKKKETLDSEDYPKSLLTLYWNLYNDYAAIILSHQKNNPLLEKDKKYFQTFRTILSELEFREGKVEKTNDKVMEHLQYLIDLEYHYVRNWSISYVSWQTSSDLLRTSNNTTTKLIVTNQGLCVGGDFGIENGFYHFALEGCGLFGSGGVSSFANDSVTYQQNLSAFGFKVGPSIYKIVSSSKTRLGISLPVIYTSQKLTQPEATEYIVSEIKPISFVPTLIARWQFDKWFVKTEFGQYIGKSEVFWGLGTGRAF